MVNGRVKILFRKSKSYLFYLILINNLEGTTFRPRRTGHRKRKSVRGCIVGSDLAVIQLRIVKKGEQEIEGITDGEKPRRLGPKRANTIRKVFNLRKVDDVRTWVVKRTITKGDKTFYKSPKVQRLITEKRLRRKTLIKRAKVEGYKAKKEAKAKYEKVLSQYIKERKALHKNKGEVAEAKPEVVAPAKAKAPAKAEPKKEEAKAPAKGKAAAPAKAAPAKPAPVKAVAAAVQKKKGGK